jgi:dihydropteroate synthase
VEERRKMLLKCRDKSIELGKRTLIMGILNVTPDSFSDGGKYTNIETAVKQAQKLIKDGADIIDIGGESTRPGHEQISVEEEIARIIPVIERINSELDTIISVDTYKYKVAEAALKAGAHIVNDIWGLQYDNGEMAALVKKYDVPLIAMHNQNDKIYKEDIILSMRKFFQKTYEIADKYDISREKIILDPGIGFGKDINLNLEVLSRMEELRDMGRILLGTSRKRFIGTILNDAPVDQRVEGTIATTVIGIEKGVDIVRVHDVLENKKAAMVADRIIRR